MPSCGAGRETVRRAPASPARSLSVPRRRHAVCTHALGPSDSSSGLDALREQLATAASKQQLGTSNQIAQLQSTLTELTSSAVSRSRDAYSEASAAVGSKVPSAEELSSKFTEQLSSATGAASTVSSDLLERSSGFRSQATEKLSVLTEKLSNTTDPARYAGQFSDLSDKVLSLTSELSSKSSDASTQFSTALEKQLAAAPEYQARFAAGADALAQNVNSVSNSVSSQASSLLSSDALNGVTEKFDDNFDVVKSLVSSGQVADLLATPGGIGAAAVATAGVLFSVSSTVSSKEPSATDTKSQTAMAVSPSQKPVSDAVSARAWIDQWRSSQTKASSPSLNGSAPATTETVSEDAAEDSSTTPVQNVVTSVQKAVASWPTPLNGVSLNGSASAPSGAYSGAMNTYDSESGEFSVNQPEGSNGASPLSGPPLNGATPPYAQVEQEEAGGVAVAEAEAEGQPEQQQVASDAAVDSPSETGSDTGAVAVEAPAKTYAITLRYFTGWDAPTIHACAAGGEWMAALMERDDSGTLTWHATVAEGAQLEGGGVAEFVITDGSGDWDKAPTGENYKLPAAGVFELHDGALCEVEET